MSESARNCWSHRYITCHGSYNFSWEVVYETLSAGWVPCLLTVENRRNSVFDSMAAQVRIDEGDNTAQYCPNLGSHQSAIVIGPVSPFASVKCWADDDGLFRLFELTDLQLKLGPVLALYQADCHFYYGIQFRK